jgi:putative ABC transport system substrate-binding protein
VKSRREFLVAGSAGLWALAMPLASFAQQPPKVARIGFLGAVSAAGYASRVDALRAGLRDLGYHEGKNLAIEFRWADGKYERLPELAAELVRLKVDVIVTHAATGTLAAKQATTAIPIVMVNVGDPIAMGIVASLARPGGNITGATFVSPELHVKRLELLKEILPRINQVAVLLNPDNRANGPVLQAIGAAAKLLKVSLQQFEARAPDEFEGAFAAVARKRADAVLVLQDTMLTANRRAILDLAAKQRLPSAGITEFAEAGSLVGYGVNSPEQFRRAAYFVDRIIKGAKPADLPVERPTKYELVINQKTAKALGITIPQSILVRADKVIE